MRVAAAPEEQQVPDGEQAAARAAREERDARLAGLVGQRGLLVLRLALLQTARRRRHRTRALTHYCTVLYRYTVYRLYVGVLYLAHGILTSTETEVQFASLHLKLLFFSYE